MAIDLIVNGEPRQVQEEPVRHLAEDSLVGWAWSPRAGRERASGTQAALGELARAWVDAGAACPADA